MVALLTLAHVSFFWSMNALGMGDLHAVTGSERATLERHLKYLKDKPGKELVESLITMLAIHHSAATQVANTKLGNWASTGEGHRYVAQDNTTVDEYLDVGLKEAMELSFEPQCLQIWYRHLAQISEEVANDHGSLLTPRIIVTPFTFHQKTVESMRKCLQSMYLAPAKIVTLRVASEWHISTHIMPSPTQASTIQRPSQTPSDQTSLLTASTEQSFDMRWQKQALKYKDDLHIYVWQPHLEDIPGAYNHVKVILPTKPISATVRRRLVLVLEPPMLLEQYVSLQHSSCPTSKMKHGWDANHELFRTVVSLFDWMISDTTEFANDLKIKITQMVS